MAELFGYFKLTAPGPRDIKGVLCEDGTFKEARIDKGQVFGCRWDLTRKRGYEPVHRDDLKANPPAPVLKPVHPSLLLAEYTFAKAVELVGIWTGMDDLPTTGNDLKALYLEWWLDHVRDTPLPPIQIDGLPFAEARALVKGWTKDAVTAGSFEDLKDRYIAWLAESDTHKGLLGVA